MGLEAGTHLGPYVIVGALGAGGMAEVYRARDTRLGRLVALKTLPASISTDPIRRARLEREAQALSAINHPNVCALYDICEHEGVVFLVMELVEGESLDERLRRGPLAFRQVVRAGIELAGALEEAHDRGLVHRDLKPSNVILTPSGVKLLDFGIARLQDAGPAAFAEGLGPATATLTREGRLVGTLQYMAPEQLRENRADARSDVFALGAVLYEAASGRRPFDGDDVASQIAAVLTREPAPLATLPLVPAVAPAFDRVVQRCLAKSADDRWQRARDVRLELEWLERAPGVARQNGGPADVIWRQRWKPLAAAAGALAVIGLLALRPIIGDLARPRQQSAALIRFDVPAPDATQFQVAGHFSAISPDGSAIAFVATSGGVRMLWIRELDALDARSIAASDGATQPFWSPDSRAVAFFADGSIKRVNVRGGRPEVIAPAQDGLAGTWGQDGVILFPSGPAGPLMRVRADGGPVEPATTLSAERREIRHGWPQFLPDGRHFLYLSVSDDERHTGVFVDALGESRPIRLLAGKTNAAYVAPGYLVWREGGDLRAQRFDADRLALRGEPTTIVADIAHSPMSGRGSFSLSDTGTLVYLPAPVGRLAWYDRRGSPRGFIGEPGGFSSPALSPDGRRVAVARRDPSSASSDIWLYDLADGSGAPLARHPANEAMPVWSPDGTRVVFGSDRLGADSLFVRLASGAAVERPLLGDAAPVEGMAAAWTPDGTGIVLESPRADRRRFRASLLDLATGRATSLLDSPPYNTRFLQLSRDGRWVAFASDESGRAEVYVDSFPRSTGKRLVSAEGGVEPHWRADGRELFYLDLTGILMSVAVDTAPSFRPGQPRPLFGTRLHATIGPGLLGRNQYDVTPDGERFLINETAPASLTVVVNWPLLLEAPPR